MPLSLVDLQLFASGGLVGGRRSAVRYVFAAAAVAVGVKVIERGVAPLLARA